jgi:hypothetical protein
MNWGLFDMDVDDPKTLVWKTGLFLSIATLCEHIQDWHIPPIILEVARLFAYFGASVAFWKVIYAAIRKKKAE